MGRTAHHPGSCFNNPGYVAPAPEPVAAVAEPAPVKPVKKPKSTRSAKNTKPPPAGGKATCAHAVALSSV